MAEPNTETVEVEPEGVVTVDVSDNPELAAVEGAEPAEVVEPEPKPAKEKVAKAPKVNAAEEAAAALTQAVKTADDARKAAEATAMAERRAREEAERVANQRTQEAAGYREQAESHELTIIESGIESATREISAHQAEWERAQEAGEWAKASAAQVKLAKAAAALDRLENSKATFEANAKRPPTTEGAVTAQGPQITPFEQYVSSFPPRAQAWLRAHPDYVPPAINGIPLGGDPIKNAAMMEGHFAAKKLNIQEGSDEYFRVIEEHTGHRTPVSAAATVTPVGETEVVPAAKPAPKPRMAQPSAPVSRDPPNGANRTTRSVTLTKEQQEAAKISFPQKPINEAFALYARNLLELEAEGKMGRLTH